MAFSVVSTGSYKSVITTVLLLLSTERYFAISKSTVARLAVLQAAKHNDRGAWNVPSHRGKGSVNKQRNGNGGKSLVPFLRDVGFFKLTRGGGNVARGGSVPSEEWKSAVAGTKKDEGPFTNGDGNKYDETISIDDSTILTIGSIDLSKVRSNSSGIISSSIVLVVDGEARKDNTTVDETLLERNLLPLFQDRANHTSMDAPSKGFHEDIHTFLESLSIVCDVLVVQIGEGETLPPEFMSCVMRGNRQRTMAGIAMVELWSSAMIGSEHDFRRVPYERKDDEKNANRCHERTTTWSFLFSSSDGDSQSAKNANELEVPSLKKIFTLFFQQVMRSKRQSTQISEETTEKAIGNTLRVPFPTISVLKSQKKSRLSTSKNDQTNPSWITSSEESKFSKQKNEKWTENKNGLIDQHQRRDEIARNEIGVAYRQLENLEEKMQELVLDQTANNMPLLEFGNLVQDILQTAETQLQNERGIHESLRSGLMDGIVAEVQRLYKDQLQALRNYYGQRYESILDEIHDDDTNDKQIIERKWAIGAEHMTQAFIAAAHNAVPAMYKTDRKAGNNEIKTMKYASFDHVDALQGLVQDMIESTERRKDEQDMAMMLLEDAGDEETTDTTPTFARKIRLPKVPKWLERLAARAVVFGVNYVQGWLAWQGIKRAALERDRHQPKFPLF